MIVDAKGCAVIPMADYLSLEKDAEKWREAVLLELVDDIDLALARPVETNVVSIIDGNDAP